MPRKHHGLFLLILAGINILLLFFAGGYIWYSQTTLYPTLPPTSPLSSPTSSPTLFLEKPIILPTGTKEPFPLTPTLLTILPSVTYSPTPLPDNVQIIGTSAGGRPILIYRFGQGQAERFIVAGIHGGNEYNTVLLAEQLMVFLSSHPEIIPKDKTLFILPNLNPDGFERSWDIYGRANDHGVDLNHNFPFQWAQDWKRDGCWRYLHLSGGDKPASEPETQALMGFILTHPIQALISYHSAALGIFPGGQPPYPPSLSLARAIAKVSDYPYPPIDTGCQVSGNLTDWAASLGIASVDIELSNHRDTDFEQNLQILETFLRWKK